MFRFSALRGAVLASSCVVGTGATRKLASPEVARDSSSGSRRLWGDGWQAPL